MCIRDSVCVCVCDSTVSSWWRKVASCAVWTVLTTTRHTWITSAPVIIKRLWPADNFTHTHSSHQLSASSQPASQWVSEWAGGVWVSSCSSDTGWKLLYSIHFTFTYLRQHQAEMHPSSQQPCSVVVGNKPVLLPLAINNLHCGLLLRYVRYLCSWQRIVEMQSLVHFHDVLSSTQDSYIWLSVKRSLSVQLLRGTWHEYAW